MLVTHITTVPLSLHFLRGQAAYMQARGVSLDFISSPGPRLDAFGREERVPVFGVPMARRITPLADLASLLALVRRLRETRPDIVHAHTPKGGLLGTLAALVARVPRRIYQVRGFPAAGVTGAKRRLLILTERVSCAAATEVWCVSHSLKSELARAGIREAHDAIVHGAGSGQGVDTSHFDPSGFEDAGRELREELGVAAEAPVVAFVGRLVAQKGVGELAEAWRHVRAAEPEAHLLLVGPFEEVRDAVPESLRAELLNDARVHHFGFVDDVRPYYSACDLVVLPTYREGFPNVLLEAAAMGKPVVATRVTGCVDAVVEKETGWLVPPRDATALGRAICVALGKVGERSAEACRAHVQSHFERESVWGAIADGYVRREPNTRMHRREASLA